MKLIIKTSLSLIVIGVLLIPSLIIPKSALADGMIIRPDPYSDRWDYLGQSSQQAFINYENGLQKMILSIDMEEASEEAVWIFPVPAEPDKVVIDVVTKLPQLRGEEITKKAKSNLLDIKKVLQITQIYTFPFVIMAERIGTYKGMKGIGAPLGMERAEIETDVIVHERLEKEGIATEIITAKTAQALYQYLQNKNLKVEAGSISVLDHYIGKEFTFVVSWISETNIMAPKPQSKQRGVFVTFPTKKIYYPLLPTSVYGSEVVPATIRIVGFVNPKVFKDIKDYTETGYFIDRYFRIGPELKNFYNDVTKNVKYTKIEINAPSKMLTEDLWISKIAPLKIFHALFIVKHPAISGILLLILSSIMTGLLVGVIIFREARNRKGLIKFGLIGIFNCLSIIGLIIATLFVKTKEIREEDKELLAKLKQRGFSTWAIQAKDLRKLGFIPLFSVSFLIISWIIVKLVELSL